MPSKRLWSYIARLEKAIKATMESSREIAALVEKIQAEGVEVSLNCIALFSDRGGRQFTSPQGKVAIEGGSSPGKRLKKKRPAPARKREPGEGGGDAPPRELELNDKDREFLRSIGIRFD